MKWPYPCVDRPVPGELTHTHTDEVSIYTNNLFKHTKQNEE